MAEPKTYQQGHHRAVTANHARRTAENEGGFVLPYLKPDFHILDVGCGPGTITSGFAKYVPQGSVTGIDLTPQVIEEATERFSQLSPKPINVTFQTGDVLKGLPFEDGKFDVIFCSQVTCHIHDPVAAFKEMKRVCKPGGIVCDREGDMPFRFVPYLPGLQLWQKYTYWMIEGKPSNPRDPEHPSNPPYGPEHRGGSLIHVWARKAGFDPLKIVKKATVQLHSTPEERELGARMMYGRLEQETGQREKFKKLGATDEEIETIVRDFKAWAADVDGMHAVMQFEVVCRN